MSTNPAPIEVQITAQIQGLQQGLTQATSGVKTAASNIATEASKMEYSMMEARHGVMMLGEEFGVRLPRAVAGFVASIGPIGAAMEAAFPVLAIAAGVTVLIEHFTKVHEAAEKLKSDTEKLNLNIQTTFNGLADKILQARIRADELSGNTLAAMHDKLVLIDHTSLNELARSFDQLGQHAHQVLSEITVSWYQVGVNTDGVKNALTEFQVKYDELLSKGEKEKAQGLLEGTLAQAEKVLALQNQLKGTGAKDRGALGMFGYDPAKASEAIATYQTLKGYQIGFTDKEVQSQTALVATLRAQLTASQQIATLNSLDKGNVTGEANKKVMTDQYRELIEAGKEYEAQQKRISAEVETFGEALLHLDDEDIHSKEKQEAREEELARKAYEEKLRIQQQEITNAAIVREEDVQGELQKYQEEAAAGTISAQALIAHEKDAENKIYAIRLKALQDQQALLNGWTNAYAQATGKIENLEKQHQQRIANLDRQAEQQRRQSYDTWFYGITSGWTSAVQGLIQGTMSWGQAFQSILSSMTNFLIDESMRMVEKWVADRLYEMIFGKATRSADVTGAASTYAVNAMASVAAIPVTGWAMAPGVGASAFALGMSFLPSAAQGWDRVPSDTLAAIHKDEMVMSAPLASGLRDLINGGGPSGGGDPHVHLHGTVIDGNWWRKNQGHIVSTIKDAIGNRRFA